MKFPTVMFSDLQVATPGHYSLVALGLYICLIAKAWISRSKVPMVGAHSCFELGLMSNFRFYKHAESILLEGYNKVSTSSLVLERGTHFG